MGSGNTTDAILGVIEIDIPSSVELVTVVRMLVATAASASESLHGDRLDDLRWVTSEAVTNAIQANQSKVEENELQPGRVRAYCEVRPGMVRLMVSDEGPGMPAEIEPPDMEDPDRLNLEGGFGVPLMRALSDGHLHFDSSPQGTTVRLELHQD